MKTILLFSLLVLVPVCVMAARRQETAAHKAAGLLNAPWTINKINVRGRSTLPPQLQAGLPPYPQQPERAQTAPTVGGGAPPPPFKP